MEYFDVKVAVLFGAVFFVLGAPKIFKKDGRNVALGLIFWSVAALIVHALIANSANISKNEIYRASIDEGALRPLSGNSSLSPVFFEWSATAALWLLAASAAWWVLAKVGVIAKIDNAISALKRKLKELKERKATKKAGLDYGGTAVRP